MIKLKYLKVLNTLFIKIFSVIEVFTVFNKIHSKYEYFTVVNVKSLVRKTMNSKSIFPDILESSFSCDEVIFCFDLFLFVYE